MSNVVQLRQDEFKGFSADEWFSILTKLTPEQFEVVKAEIKRLKRLEEEEALS